MLERACGIVNSGGIYSQKSFTASPDCHFCWRIVTNGELRRIGFSSRYRIRQRAASCPAWWFRRAVLGGVMMGGGWQDVIPHFWILSNILPALTRSCSATSGSRVINQSNSGSLWGAGSTKGWEGVECGVGSHCPEQSIQPRSKWRYCCAGPPQKQVTMLMNFSVRAD